jgi:hypothetical protein
MAGVSVTVGGDASKAIGALNSVQKKGEVVADSISKGFQKSIDKIKNGFQERIGHKLFDGLVRAANALPNAMKSAIDAGGRLSDQMARTGAAGEGLVIMERWLTNAGLSAEKTTSLLGLMQRGIAGLNEDMQPTGEAFARLNLRMEDLRSMDPVAAFQKIGAAIMNIQDPAERTALAMQVFGRSGAEALVAFSDAAGFDAARQSLGAMPGILAENAAALDAVSDRLGNLGTGWQQIGTAAAVAVLPALEKITAQVSSMDLTAIGNAIGALLSAIVAIAPQLLAVGAAMLGLKITSFISGLAAKTSQWWAETAAIKANTLALRENAGASSTAGGAKAAGGGVGRGGMLAGGGALAVLAIGATAANMYADKLAQANDAMAASFERGNAAASKFEVSAIRGQVATRAEIEEVIVAIEKEKEAIQEAAQAQVERTDDAATRGRIIEDTVTTIRLLDLKAKKLRATTNEQLAANQAVRAAAEAEKQAARDREEAIRKIAAAKKQAEEDAKRAAEEQERTDKSRGSAMEDWREEMKILTAQIQGQDSKVEALQKEAEIRKEIARLVDAGYSPEEAQLGAGRLVEARAQAQEAEDAELAKKRRQEAGQSALDTLYSAHSIVEGQEQMEKRNRVKRAQEISEQSGLSIDESTAIADNEADLQKLAGLRSQKDGMQFQSTIGRVSDMQRIGGGGGVVSSGIDIARQQADLQRQMVTLLGQMFSRMPSPTLSDY